MAASISDYRKIVLLTEGYSTPFLGKTAISLLRYRTPDIVGVLDASQAGRTAQEVFGVGGGIPFIGSLSEVEAEAVFVGIAPPGGDLPSEWRGRILEALRRGMDIVSGLHFFLTHDEEFMGLAQKQGCRLLDVRRNQERETARHVRFEGLRIHTVGHDCSVGKMVAALEIQRELMRRGRDAQFLATGQTGIMISGFGVPVDAVVADFVNGATERLVMRHQHHEILLIEGQGSLVHPSFSAVTLGLLHGCAPDGLVMCYEVGRDKVKSFDHVATQPLRKLIGIYELMGSARHPCRVIGIAMNSRKVDAAEAAAERRRVEAELGLPVCDVYRDGPAVLADAVERLGRELGIGGAASGPRT